MMKSIVWSLVTWIFNSRSLANLNWYRKALIFYGMTNILFLRFFSATKCNLRKLITKYSSMYNIMVMVFLYRYVIHFKKRAFFELRICLYVQIKSVWEEIKVKGGFLWRVAKKTRQDVCIKYEERVSLDAAK